MTSNTLQLINERIPAQTRAKYGNVEEFKIKRDELTMLHHVYIRFSNEDVIGASLDIGTTDSMAVVAMMKMVKEYYASKWRPKWAWELHR